ncbi:MAG: DUF4031 domain-containing protein [Armatimonadota bacterium]
MIILHRTGLQYRGRDAWHMTSTESIEDLHKFASKIGMKREWFQDKPHHQHYDVLGTRVNNALNEGAIVVNTKVYLARRLRSDGRIWQEKSRDGE